MRSADIRLVIGTRPEAIKLKPVARALRAHGLMPTLVLTGQHATLDCGELGLEAFRRCALRCPGQEDPHAHVRSVTAALLPMLRNSPDLIVVQGDTSSALGGALAGFTGGRARRACRGGFADPRSAAALAGGGISHRDRCPRRTAVRADRDRRREPAGGTGARRNSHHRQHRGRCGARYGAEFAAAFARRT